ncbi:polysaccharide biosynthesis protein [Nitrincola iocasae]
MMNLSMKRAMKRASLHVKFMSLQRAHKRLLMVAADTVALPLALWSAYTLRFADLWPEIYLYPAAWLFVLLPLVGILVFIRLGLYRAVVRYMGAQAIWTVAFGVLILSLLLWAAAFVFHIKPFPRSIPINFALVAMIYVGGSRLLMRSYYHWLLNHYLNKDSVLIYGAGGSGVQLAKALDGSEELSCVGFLDDDASLWGSSVAGFSVYDPASIPELIAERKITSVLLAMPSATPKARKRILDRLADYPVHVRTVPAMHDIVSGESVASLREIEIEDLLGREPVPPMQPLIDASIRDKVVLVTGAGGSIGSEVCRQVLLNRPRTLILYEQSEFALYSIEQKLQQQLHQEPFQVDCIALLGSVCDRSRVQEVLQRFPVQTIYHAAAYKHVPLVEHNILEGIRNNALGTQVIAEAAKRSGVERFVLISTDKAVRPTNVMGATKRLAELILQDLAAGQLTVNYSLAERAPTLVDDDPVGVPVGTSVGTPVGTPVGARSASEPTPTQTIFSMVRFGNVLGSSGSVVPLFRKQIESGGPVTVTHPDITRYFMTIPEAASLVIQAGSMAKGGDVFVLDMGESVRIVDLARRMIRLMGYEVLDEKHPDGEIEIIYSGLRPGEKLFEELLIGEDVVGTEHPKIMRAQEEKLSPQQLAEILVQMNNALKRLDCAEARSLLEQAVSGFKPMSELVDWLAVDSAK